MLSRKKTAMTRVRILIMGAAGVGKTTILQKICSEEEPIVRNPKGKLIQKLDSLIPTTARGLHDVNLEITYPSRPGFVFHDSRGLESGSVNELNEIREFLVRRAKKEKTAVHVIWYCVSAGTCRPLVAAERQFFERDRGQVPVIVIFTKLDGLETKAFSDLLAEKLTREAAHQGVPERADQLLRANFVKPIMEMAHPPMGYVAFKDLHEPEGQCAELTRKTVEALGHNRNVQMMFALASKYDLEARVNAVINKVNVDGTDEGTIRETIVYFPHVWLMGASYRDLLGYRRLYEEYEEREITPFVSSIATVVPPKPPVADWHRRASTLAGTCIAADICFWTSQQAASSPMTQEELLPHFQHALDQYQKEKKDVIIQAICQIPDGLSDEDRSGAVKQLILQHGQFSPVAKARAL